VERFLEKQRSGTIHTTRDRVIDMAYTEESVKSAIEAGIWTTKQLISKAILEFDCPECANLDKCIDSLECRLYAAGRQDAAAIAVAIDLGQQSESNFTPSE